jgi:hypothetical protein
VDESKLQAIGLAVIVAVPLVALVSFAAFAMLP